MAVTRSFKELVQRRVTSDAAFAENLLREGVDTMLSGDVETGKAILRDYIKATVGFEKLGEATDTPAKSSDPHVQSARQSASAQSLRRHRLFAKTSGYRTSCDAEAAVSGQRTDRVGALAVPEAAVPLPRAAPDERGDLCALRRRPGRQQRPQRRDEGERLIDQHVMLRLTVARR